MGIIENLSGAEGPDIRQRWAHYLTILVAVLGVLAGLVLRNDALFAVVPYTNTEAGIRALYPANWLIDTQGDYVFRVRNTIRTGFRTTIQVATRPISADTTSRNIFDTLSFNRSQTLADYNVTATEAITLGDDIPATQMAYSYVARQTNPFLQSVPEVVRGLDILVLSRGQAIVITFRAAATAYDVEYQRFQQFLDSLVF